MENINAEAIAQADLEDVVEEESGADEGTDSNADLSGFKLKEVYEDICVPGHEGNIAIGCGGFALLMLYYSSLSSSLQHRFLSCIIISCAVTYGILDHCFTVMIT